MPEKIKWIIFTIGLLILIGIIGSLSPNLQKPKSRDETGNIVDLLKDNKIELVNKEVGFLYIQKKIRKLVTHPIEVIVPAGTIFFPDLIYEKTTMVIESKVIRLVNDDWQLLGVKAIAIQLSNDHPNEPKIQRLPADSDLAKLMKIPMQDEAVIIAAVGILSRDATYDSFKNIKLISYKFPGIEPIDGPRAVNEKKTALAMRSIEKAGIDVTKRAIWIKDRLLILNGLSYADGDIKDWLEKRISFEDKK